VYLSISCLAVQLALDNSLQHPSSLIRYIPYPPVYLSISCLTVPDS
jgi:hypothetical protein